MSIGVQSTKNDEYLADWHDRKGKRKRKSFSTPEDAHAYEDLRKAEARRKARREGFNRNRPRAVPQQPSQAPHSPDRRKLVNVFGQGEIADLGTAHVAFINVWLASYENSFSKHRRAGAAKRIFRFLWEEWGAPPLFRKVLLVTKPKPRNVRATADERQRLIAAAPPSALLASALLGHGWKLSELLRQLRACVYALDHDLPPTDAPVPESLGELGAVRVNKAAQAQFGTLFYGKPHRPEPRRHRRRGR